MALRASLVLAGLLQGCAGCDVRILPPKIAQGGRAMSIAVAPGSGASVFVASETGGLFQSRDGGASWTHLRSLPSWLVSDVEVHPTDASLLLAATREDFKTENGGGIWRSTDGGQIWSRPTRAQPRAGARCPERITAWAVAFDPDGEMAYAAHDCGLAISRDRGASWKHVQLDANRFVDPYRRQNRVWDVVAFGGGRVNVAADDGLWTSADSGGTWTRSAGTPSDAQDGIVHALAASPFDRDHVFLAAGTNKLFFSSDAGLTWSEVRAGGGGRPAFVRVARSVSKNPEEFDVYFGAGASIHRRTFRHGQPPVPQGGDWTPVVVDHVDPADVAFRPGDQLPLLLASDGGLHGTADEGATWTLQGSAYDGYNALQITEVTGQIVEGKEPHTDLYFGTQDNDVLASPDGGATWPRRRCCEGFYLRTLRRSTDHEGAKVSGVSCSGCGHFIGEPHLATHGTFPSEAPPGPDVSLDIPILLQSGHYLQRVMFPTLAPGRSFFYLTQDTGGSWDFRGDSEEQFMGRPLLGGPPDQPVIYYAVRRPGTTVQGYPKIGLLRIENVYGPAPLAFAAADGAGFGSQGTFPTMFAWYQVFGVDPEDPAHLLVADIEKGAMQVSWDGGASWAVDAALTDLVLGGGAYRFSVDGFVRNGFLHPHVIEFDPDNPCHIVVGTAENGILRSADGGVSWEKVEDTELVTNLSSIFFSAGRNLYVSSYGRSLWLVRIERPARGETALGPWRCTGGKGPARVAAEPAPPAPIWVEAASGERRPFEGLEKAPPCAGCRWVTVAWGRFTALAVEGERVGSLAVSGGVVRGLAPAGAAAGEGGPALPALELRAAPGELGPYDALKRLTGERLSIRAVELDAHGGLRAVVAAREELFTAGLVPPRLQVLARETTAGDPAVASGARFEVLGGGFEPGATVEILLDGAPWEARATADESGGFRLELTASLPPGDYALEAVQRLPDGLRAERTPLRVVVSDEPRGDEADGRPLPPPAPDAS